MIAAVRTGLDRCGLGRARSVNHRIFAAMITIGGCTVSAGAAAALRDLIVAYRFGTSDARDAFLIALVLPSFIVGGLAGSFGPAFIPAYIRVRELEGREPAQRLLSGLLACCVGWLIVVAVSLSLAASFVLPLIGSGFDAGKLALTRSLFLVLLPIVVLRGWGAVCAAALNAGERFAVAAMAPAVSPIVAVLVLLIAGRAWGIHALAAGTVVGAAVEVLLLGWAARAQGISVVPRWYGMTKATRQALRQYAAMAAGALVLGGTRLVDHSMAAMLGPGSVSALSYGAMVVEFLLGLCSVPLGTAVLPYFSQMVTRNDWHGVRHTLKTYTGLILLLTVPVTGLLALFSTPLVRLLFERGAFTPADTLVVSRVQMLYVLQVPFFLLGILIPRLLSSLHANHLLMWGAVGSFCLNVVLNYVFMQWLGVAGIALSTSLVYAITSISLFGVSLHLIGRHADDRS